MSDKKKKDDKSTDNRDFASDEKARVADTPDKDPRDSGSDDKDGN